jgi:hypothetical protein
MPTWGDALAFWLTFTFMLIGLIGLIVPIFPGIMVIWLAALIYGIVTGFDIFGAIMFILISAGFLAGVSVDNLLMGVGARQGGASWWTIGIGILAGLAGTLLFPPLGGFIAAPAAVFLVEFWRNKEWRSAWKATRGLALGWGLSFLVRVGIGALMIAFWLIWALV